MLLAHAGYMLQVVHSMQCIEDGSGKLASLASVTLSLIHSYCCQYSWLYAYIPKDNSKCAVRSIQHDAQSTSHPFKSDRMLTVLSDAY